MTKKCNQEQKCRITSYQKRMITKSLVIIINLRTEYEFHI